MEPPPREGGDRIDLGLTTPLVHTHDFDSGLLIAKAAVRVNAIVAIDGVPGVGKTTCIRQIANEVDRPVAIATLPDRPKPNDLLRYTYKAIGGGVTDGMSHFDLQTEVLALLRHDDWIIIVDEMQQAAANAMAELVWLYEQTYHSFGIVVAGSGVLTAVQRYPQLATRIMGKVHFRPLTGTRLLDAVTTLDPRLAGTPHTTLLDHDQNLCRGRLRPWVLTVQWLDILGLDRGPVPVEVFAQVGNLMVTPQQDL